MTDVVALAISYAFVGTVVGSGEVARRRYGVSAFVTRKLVHAAVGTWVIPTFFLFGDWRWAIVPPLTFLAMNTVALSRGTFRSIEGADPRNYGPVFFPAAFVILLPLFWGEGTRVAAGAGILSMAWGDPLASAVGRAIGKRRYRLFGAVKSLEGSAFMFLGSVGATLVAAAALADLGPGMNLRLALYCGATAAVVEAGSPWGADDLTVPAAVALVARALLGSG